MDILKSDDLNFDYIEVGNVDEEGILIFVHQSLKDIIFSKAGNPVFAKTYGLLLGSKIKSDNRYIVHINNIMPLGRLNHDRDPRAFSVKRWDAVQNKAFNTYPTQEIVGWYGVRKGWGAMLTEQDQRIHQELFVKSWHVIYLLDNSDDVGNFFHWEGDKLRLCTGYYEYWDDESRESKKTLLENQKKMIVGLIGAIIIILTVYLSGQSGGDPSIPKDNLTIAGDSQETGADDSLKENSSGGDDKVDEAKADDHLARIAELETELEDKQREIEALEKEIGDLEQEVEREKAAQEPDEVASAGTTVYIVQSGDNLYNISQRFYGTERYNQALARINRIKDQKALMVGDYLVIPPVDEIENRD